MNLQSRWLDSPLETWEGALTSWRFSRQVCQVGSSWSRPKTCWRDYTVQLHLDSLVGSQEELENVAREAHLDQLIVLHGSLTLDGWEKGIICLIVWFEIEVGSISIHHLHLQHPIQGHRGLSFHPRVFISLSFLEKHHIQPSASHWAGYLSKLSDHDDSADYYSHFLSVAGNIVIITAFIYII